jgi:hypothetical protein
MAIKKLSQAIQSIDSYLGNSNKHDIFNSSSFAAYGSGNGYSVFEKSLTSSVFSEHTRHSENRVANQFLVRFNQAMSQADRLAILKSVGADEAYTEASETNTGVVVAKVANPTDLDSVALSVIILM